MLISESNISSFKCDSVIMINRGFSSDAISLIKFIFFHLSLPLKRPSMFRNIIFVPFISNIVGWVELVEVVVALVVELVGVELECTLLVVELVGMLASFVGIGGSFG